MPYRSGTCVPGSGNLPVLRDVLPAVVKGALPELIEAVETVGLGTDRGPNQGA